MARIRQSRSGSGLGFQVKLSLLRSEAGNLLRDRERELFIDDILFRIHSIMEIILVDWPSAMAP